MAEGTRPRSSSKRWLAALDWAAGVALLIGRHWRLLLVTLGALLVLAYVGLAAIVLPGWIVSLTGAPQADDNTRLKAVTDTRGALLGLLAPLAVVIGGIAALLNYRATTEQNREVLRLQSRGQVTERFSKAIEQLGQDDKLDVRIGAVYALEQIAQDSAELHWPILEVLTAYLREHKPLRAADDTQAEPDASTGRMPADRQAIATVIGRRASGRDPVDQSLDLHQADLQHVRWTNAALAGANLRGAHLAGAQLQGADLGERRMWARSGRDVLPYLPPRLRVSSHRATNLAAPPTVDEVDDVERRIIEDPLLSGPLAKLQNWTGMVLLQPHLAKGYMGMRKRVQGARLEGACLIGAHLEGAYLQGAHLEKAKLQGAHLEGTDLKRVDLRKVEGLTWNQVREAKNVDRNLLPDKVREAADLEAAAAAKESGPKP